MTSERLWSPQMRKWAKDAHLHGIQIGFARTGIDRDRWEGAGVPQNLDRMTDDGGLRILDSPIGLLDTAQPRTIDRPSGIVGPTVPLAVSTAAGINTRFKIKVDGQTIIKFGGKDMKI